MIFLCNNPQISVVYEINKGLFFCMLYVSGGGLMMVVLLMLQLWSRLVVRFWSVLYIVLIPGSKIKENPFVEQTHSHDTREQSKWAIQTIKSHWKIYLRMSLFSICQSKWCQFIEQEIYIPLTGDRKEWMFVVKNTNLSESLWWLIWCVNLASLCYPIGQTLVYMLLWRSFVDVIYSYNPLILCEREYPP